MGYDETFVQRRLSRENPSDSKLPEELREDRDARLERELENAALHRKNDEFRSLKERYDSVQSCPRASLTCLLRSDLFQSAFGEEEKVRQVREGVGVIN